MNSSRTRLLLATILVTGIAMAAFASWSYRASADALRSEVRQDSSYLDLVLNDRVLGLAQALDHSHPAEDWQNGAVPELSGWITRFMAGSNQAIFKQVWSADGALAGKSRSMTWDIPLSEAARGVTAEDPGPLLETLVLEEGQELRISTYPLWDDATGQVVAFAQTGIQLPETAPRLERLKVKLVAGFAVVWILLAAGIGWLLWRARSPWRQLQEKAAAIGARNFWRDRLPPDGDAETRELAGEINAMLDRIEETYAAHRRFVADSAHELATPLTALRGEIEVALRRDRSQDEYREVLGNAHAETERLSRLAENLLTLAAADAGEAIGPREMIGLGDLLRDVGQRLSSRAAELGLMIETAGDTEVRVRADRDALLQVVMNLAENGLRHTPPGGRVVLAAGISGEHAVITVSDTGEGIDAAHLPHLFERFYRADKSRSRKRGGAGLGLAIVKALVEAQGGRVSADSIPGQGSTFRVELPLAGN